jgi:peptidoglycan/LPS O-acetylase OafA/YrhL
MAEPVPADLEGDAPFRLGYRPALDGIRGVAVLAVMGYHVGLSWLRGGFLGVDAFFVLSGFLITCLLLEEWRSRGRISLRNFYARRLLRLTPALLIVLFAVIVDAVFFSPSSVRDAIYPEAASTVLYAANWFAASTTQFPFHLAHTWSLAIEEQFYLVWPLLLVGILAWWGRLRAVVWCTIGGALASAVLMMLMTGFGDHDLVRAYFGTDTRAQALLIGCAIASLAFVGRLPSSPRAREVFRIGAIAGAVFVVGLWVLLAGTGSSFLFAGGFTLEGLAVGCIVVHVVQEPAAPFPRALAVEPLRWVGRISYGLYLWHWPVFNVVSRWDLAFWPGVVVKFGITFGCAIASYYGVEQPVLGLKRRFRGADSGRAAAAGPGPGSQPLSAPAM